MGIYSILTRLSSRDSTSHMAAPSSICALFIPFNSVGFLRARMNITGDGFSTITTFEILLKIASDTPRSNTQWPGTRILRQTYEHL